MYNKYIMLVNVNITLITTWRKFRLVCQATLQSNQVEQDWEVVGSL